MRAAKVQASLRICTVSPEPPLLAHTSSESRGTFRQKARSLAPLNGWDCAVKICHDGMLKDTNSLAGAHMLSSISCSFCILNCRSVIKTKLDQINGSRKSLWIRGVCHSVYIFWKHYSMLKPHSSISSIITANFWGIQIFFSNFYGHLPRD